MREFFSRTKNNPVLFAEALFFKPPQVIQDIRDPGIKGRIDKQKMEKKAQREEKNKARLDGLAQAEESDEDEFGLDSLVDSKAWEEKENKVLQDYYPEREKQNDVN